MLVGIRDIVLFGPSLLLYIAGYALVPYWKGK